MQQQLTALMQQLAPEVSPRPDPGQQLTAHHPPPSPHQSRPPLQAGDLQRAAPRPPCAPDICGQCEHQEAHICLHSYAQSDLSGGSAHSQCHHSESPSSTGTGPHLPPAATQQPVHMTRWVQDSDPGAQAAVSPTPAAEELPHYVGSVTSSINIRHELSVASQLRKLNKSISSMQNTADIGEKIIAYKQKEMSVVADKIRAKVEGGEEQEPGFMAEIEASLDKSDELAESAIRKLDKLATEEEENKAMMASRPKIAFETFSGDVSQYPNFLANQEQIFENFYDANAQDKGASQQLYQLSKMLAQDPARTVLSFSGAQDSAQKAKKWLSLKFNSPKIIIPLVYQEVKNLLPARSEAEIPLVAERAPRKIESLSALTKDDKSVLPSDVVQAGFRALFLSREE